MQALPMKHLPLLLSLFLAPVFSAPVLAQDPPKKAIESEEALQIVFANIVRTAYLSVHGNLDGFDPSAVSCESLAPVDAKSGDLSAWVAYSHPFRSRVGTIRRMDEKGRIYHVWADLLRDKRAAKLILANHYAG